MNRFFRFKTISITMISLWIIILIFMPNLLVIAASFMERDEIGIISLVPTLEHYASLFEPVYFEIFTKSITYAVVTTILCLVAAYPFAYIVSKLKPVQRKLCLLLVIIPFWTSSLIRTYALIVILKSNGILNSFLLYTGLTDTPLEIMYTDIAVYTGLVYTLLPFMIMPLYASIEKLDRRLIEAAYDLGASAFQVFTRIIIPVTMPGIIAGCIMVFLPALGLFYIPDLLGGAKSILIGNFIRNQFLTAGNWPFGSAASVFLTVLMTGMMIIYFRAMKKFNASLMD